VVDAEGGEAKPPKQAEVLVSCIIIIDCKLFIFADQGLKS
jgi:hypothetical protein